MIAMDDLNKLGQNLSSLGPRRQLALGLVGLLLLGVVGLMAYGISTSPMKMLYTGLLKTEVSSIASVLTQSGIKFDVNSKGDSVLVRPGDTAKARMILAERGLPSGASSGYELFDKLGSLGLTSFMQEVTRKRALEGEIARTIQAMRGIIAARVHIVLPDPGSFRRSGSSPSASVVIRSTSGSGTSLAGSIRHLVAAAVPGLSAEQVTVLGTDGVLLASGGSVKNKGAEQKVTLEGSISRELQEKINATLTPFLGLQNFRSSVTVRLNTDEQESRVVEYDPQSRVERSVRVIKENKSANSGDSKKPVSVQENTPDQGGEEAPKASSSRRDDRREETTNFEVGSRVTQTKRNGYRLDRLTVAVVVNKSRIDELLELNKASGAAGTTDPAALIKQFEALVETSVGVKKDRGDKVTISVIDFVPDSDKLSPIPESSMLDRMSVHAGTLINAGALVLSVVLLIMLGLRPLMRELFSAPTVQESPMLEVGSVPTDDVMAPDLLSAPGVDSFDSGGMPDFSSNAFDASGNIPGLEEEEVQLTDEERMRKRLEELVADEDKAVAALRSWLHEGARA